MSALQVADRIVKTDYPPPGFEEHPEGGLRELEAMRHPLALRSFVELIREMDAAGPREWDVEGLIVHGQHGVLGSTPKAGKGWDVVDLAISVASGTPWLGRFACPNAGPVALFPGEEDAYELRRRFEAVAEARSVRADRLPIHIADNTPRLTRREDLDLLHLELEGCLPRLTIIDPLYKAAAGADARSLIQMGEMLADASDITRSLGSTLLAVTHFNRDTSKKGAERFTGAGPQEWGRFLMAGSVTTRKRTVEGGSEVVRSVEVSGTSIPDQSFTVLRRIQPVIQEDPDSPLIYEVEVREPKETGSDEHPELDYSLRLILDALGPEADAAAIPEIQGAMKAARPERNPYTRTTLSTKLNELEGLGLAKGRQDGSSPKRWWRV
jgi:hypothetical protein